MDKSIEKVVERPDPNDLQAFLPWACGQLQVPHDVVIIRSLQNEYVSAIPTSKTKGKSKTRLPSVADLVSTFGNFSQLVDANAIRINAVYDYADNLVALRFENNGSLPRMIMQVLGLIIKFQIYLQSITINQGLNKYVVYELANILPNSRITEICLDHCFLSEGTYYTLLENASNLRNLSLSRCRINDEAVALIAAQLCCPNPSSTTLIILNLSSNRITDIGAHSIRDALKLNFKLAYLNLADNVISDDGAASILNVLLEFPLTKKEVEEKRRRYIDYLRNRRAVVTQIAKDMRLAEMLKNKKLLPRPKGRGDMSFIAEKPAISDAYYYEKAQAIAGKSLTPYKDPYSAENVQLRDGITYCFGNNNLSILNLSYNNLSYLSVVKVLEVLTYQREASRKPKGLLNVRLEGNALPVGCSELGLVEDLLDYAQSGGKRGGSAKKKVR